MFAASKEQNKDLPVQVVPVYPSTHAHCDDEHIVLASAAEHWVFDEHAIPTTAERNRRKYHKIIISCKPTIRSEALSLVIGGSRRGTGGPDPPPPPEKSRKIGFLSNTSPDPLKNHKATKPALNVGPSSARQRHHKVPFITKQEEISNQGSTISAHRNPNYLSIQLGAKLNKNVVQQKGKRITLIF